MYAINRLPIIDMSTSTTGCCALIDPKQWDEQVFVFKDKLFAVASTSSILHLPLNMSSVMKKSQKKIQDSGAEADEFLILSDERSLWKADHYFAVRKEVDGMQMQKMSGIFMTKVFEGPYKDAQKWYDRLVQYVENAGKKPLQMYFFYTTCPNCAKVYGKNYVVGFAKISD